MAEKKSWIPGYLDPIGMAIKYGGILGQKIKGWGHDMMEDEVIRDIIANILTTLELKGAISFTSARNLLYRLNQAGSDKYMEDKLLKVAYVLLAALRQYKPSAEQQKTGTGKWIIQLIEELTAAFKSRGAAMELAITANNASNRSELVTKCATEDIDKIFSAYTTVGLAIESFPKEKVEACKLIEEKFTDVFGKIFDTPNGLAKPGLKSSAENPYKDVLKFMMTKQGMEISASPATAKVALLRLWLLDYGRFFIPNNLMLKAAWFRYVIEISNGTRHIGRGTATAAGEETENGLIVLELMALVNEILENQNDSSWFLIFCDNIHNELRKKLSISFDQTKERSDKNKSLQLFELQALCADKYRDQLDKGICGFTFQDIQRWDRLKCLDMLDILEFPGFKPGDPTYEYIKKSKRAQCRLGVRLNEGELESVAKAANDLADTIQKKLAKKHKREDDTCEQIKKGCGYLPWKKQETSVSIEDVKNVLAAKAEETAKKTAETAKKTAEGAEVKVV